MNLKSILNNHWFHFLALGVFLFYGLLPSFSGSAILLGGDGDYHLNYTRTLRYGYSWAEDGLGGQNYGINSIFSVVLLLSAGELVIKNPAIIKFILIFSIYYLTFLSAYLMARQLKISHGISFLMGLFYLLNPFNFIYFTRLNMALTMIPATLMFFGVIILRYYHHNFKLFFIFGFTSLMLAFTSLNPPFLIIIQVAIFCLVNIISVFFKGCFNLRDIMKKYLIIMTSFLLFNIWWILNEIFFLTSGTAGAMYTKVSASLFLDMVMANAGNIIMRLITLTAYVPLDQNLNFFGYYYALGLSQVLIFIPILLVLFLIFIIIKKQRKMPLHIVFTMVVALITLFFAKGNAFPFGFVYDFFLKYFPLFYLFKGPIEKFGVFYLFIFTILFIFLLKETLSRGNYQWLKFVLIFYLFFCSIPVLTGNMLPWSRMSNIENYMEGENYEALLYKDEKEYQELRAEIDNDKVAYRVISFPGSKEYYTITFKTDDRLYYSGIDPILANTNHPFIIYSQNTAEMYRGFLSENYLYLLGLYNIKKIVLNKNLIPRYGFPEDASPETIKKIFDKQLPSKNFDGIYLYNGL